MGIITVKVTSHVHNRFYGTKDKKKSSASPRQRQYRQFSDQIKKKEVLIRKVTSRLIAQHQKPVPVDMTEVR